MIGQKRLLGTIRQLVDKDIFPRFSIIVGPSGSGKKTVAHAVFGMLSSGVFTECGTGIDDIRNMIKESYRLNGVQSVYLISDADGMSVQAKNALLKITEEPPKGAYFIMTLEDVNNTLDTIKSRGAVFYTETYTRNEIEAYTKQQTDDIEVVEIAKDLCETPGEVNVLLNLNLGEFYDYVKLTFDNVASVSLANALKISNRIAIKADDAEKYDLKLFWKAFINVCSKSMTENDYVLHWIIVTSKALKSLRTKGINRQMLFDKWLFEIRDWS